MFPKSSKETKVKRKSSLLMEPSVEEERLANERSFDFSSLRKAPCPANRKQPTSDINPPEKVDQKCNSSPKRKEDVIIEKQEGGRQRSRQKADLTSLLMILFGSILLIGCFAVQLVQPANQLPANKTLQHSEVVKVSSESANLSGGNSTTAPTTTAPAAEDPSSDSGEDAVEEELAEPTSKQADLIMNTFTSAVDLYVSRLKPADKEDGASESENENDNDPEADSDKPEAESSANNATLPLTPKADKRQAEDDKPEAEMTTNKTNTQPAMETYLKWRQGSEDIIELFSKKLLPVIVEHGYDIDAVTVTGVLQVFNAIRGLKTWALRLVDSWAKLTPGILVGTQSDFGDFDECLNVRADDPNGLETSNPEIPVEIDEATGLKTTTVIGKYCLADVIVPLPAREKLAQRNEELQSDFAPIELRRPLLNFSQTAAFKDTIFVETGNFLNMLYVDPIRVAFCLTNKINEDSFAKVFNILAEPLNVKIDFKGRCVTKYDRTPWTIQQKVSAWVLLICCCLVAVSTLFDILHTKLIKLPLPGMYLFDKQEVELWKANARSKLFKYRPLFTSFSIIRNTKRLFKPQANKLLQQVSSSASQQNSSAGLSLRAPNCSDSSTSGGSTPSIERRSSTSGSAHNLISEPSISSSASFVEVTKRDLVLKQALQNSSNAPVNSDKSNLNLSCLHGVRVITMTWMIVNHTYLFGGFFVLWAHRRLIDIAEWPKSVSFQLVLNGWLTVETYFFLSALIIVLNIMPLFKARKFAYAHYIFHRLLRLLPAYVGLVCLNFLWPLVSSGPVWLVKGKSFIQTPCENYLWTNFLFINNWIWPEKQCMVHTWFLSADLQLYLLAPIIVYLLYRRPVFGHSLNIFIAIIASLVSGLVIYANKLMPTTLINKLEFDSIKQQLSYSYFATYQHMGPYCLGIFTGYLLHKRPRVRLPKHLTWALWLLLPPLSFTTLFLTYLWNGAYSEPDMINPSALVSAFYVAIHRTIWTSLVAWIVFACSTGRAKILANFLSHSTFVPLSRLSFSIYLVHLPIIMFRALNLRHTVEWTDSNILWEACGNFVVSLMAGYFVNVTFESPFINLEAALFRGGSSKMADLRICKGAPEVGSISRRNSNSDSEDAKSADTGSNSEQQSSVGSPEELAERKRLEVNLREAADWSLLNGALNKTNGFHRRALRPKQNLSVEKIFGHQLEPASPEVVVESKQDEEDDGKVHPDAADEEPAYTEFVYHQPGAKKANDFRSSHVPAHGSQYATLARTSRFYASPHASQTQHERVAPIYFRPDELRGRKSRSQLAGESPVSRYEQQWANFAELEAPASELAGRGANFQGYANRPRRARYNTLTGAGRPLDEWNQRFGGQPIPLTRIEDPNARWILNQQPSQFVQAGLMIPRIDSSTLRRQQAKRLEKVPADRRIVEEEPVSYGEVPEASEL